MNAKTVHQKLFCIDGGMLSFKEREDRRISASKILDINDKDPDGWAPIHTACWRKPEINLAVAQLLLDRNADLEVQNSSDKTPLHLALEAGDQETTRMILEKSENIEIADEEGLTPLHVTAQHQNAEAIGVLIRKSANLEAEDKGRRPLHHAISSERSRGGESNCKSIVELFLNNYAPIDASEDEERHRYIRPLSTVGLRLCSLFYGIIPMLMHLIIRKRLTCTKSMSGKGGPRKNHGRTSQKGGYWRKMW